MENHNKNVYQLVKKQEGAVAVEFAIILIIFVLLIFAIIEFGLLVYNQHVVTNAGREGIRAGSVMRVPRLDDDDIREIILNKMESYIVMYSEDEEEIDWEEAIKVPYTCKNEDSIETTINYKYNYIIIDTLASFFGKRLESPTLTSHTVMNCE